VTKNTRDLLRVYTYVDKNNQRI